MSEYSIMRSKKNAEMLNAMANVRKDLYEWKPSSPNFFKYTKANSQLPPPQRLKSIDSLSSQSTSLKRSDSMKDLNQKQAITATMTTTATAINSTVTSKLHLRSNSTQMKKTLITPELNIEDLDADDLNNSDEKCYLSSARNVNFLMIKKTDNEIEAELNSKLDNNEKDPRDVQELDLSQCNLKATKNLQKNLIELRLYANKIENLENLENLTELQSLQLQANRIRKLNKCLNSMKKLEYLRLDRNEIESIGTNEISSCSNLIYLNISHNNKIDSLKFINCLPNLEQLDASFLNLKRLDEIDSNRCKKLSELDLSYNGLNDDCFSSLENLSSLNTLKVSNNKLKSVRLISNIRSLKNLDISNNQIEIIEDLKKLKDLETLDVSSNKISQWTQLEKLVLCGQLVELQFLNNPICDENSEKNALYRLPNLKIINELTIDSNSNNSTPEKFIQNSSSAKNMLLMQVDLKNFEQEMEIFNQNFLTKFNDIKQTLNALTNENDNELDRLKTKQEEAKKASIKKSSKNRLIDALKYSKNLN